MKETKFIYEKAIERFLDFEKKHKEWTYMYAIFTGALFVAYYNLFDKVSEHYLLLILISAIGVLTGFCWLGSHYGHFRWCSNWITILHFHEEQYLEETYSNDEDKKNKHRLYTLVHKKSLKGSGLSTPKITNLFIRLVIVVWCFVLCFSIFELHYERYSYHWKIILLILSVIFILYPFICFCCCRFTKERKRKKCWLLSDISNHYKLIREEGNKFRVKKIKS